MAARRKPLTDAELYPRVPLFEYGEEASRRWAAILRENRPALEAHFGKLGPMLGCGAYGCTVAASRGRVLKLTQSANEVEWMAHMQREQKLRGHNPAKAGVVKVYQIVELEKGTPLEHRNLGFAILREGVEPMFRISTRGDQRYLPSHATTEQLGWPGYHQPASGALRDLLKESSDYPQLPAALEGVLSAVNHYGLMDTHVGNVGWVGAKVKIFDASARHQHVPKPHPVVMVPNEGSDEDYYVFDMDGDEPVRQVAGPVSYDEAVALLAEGSLPRVVTTDPRSEAFAVQPVLA
jgi:hypothetical protein